MNFIERRANLFQKMNDTDVMTVEDIENGEASIYCQIDDCAGIAVEKVFGKEICADCYEKIKIDENNFAKVLEDVNLRK